MDRIVVALALAGAVYNVVTLFWEEASLRGYKRGLDKGVDIAKERVEAGDFMVKAAVGSVVLGAIEDVEQMNKCIGTEMYVRNIALTSERGNRIFIRVEQEVGEPVNLASDD